ncbi:TonB-dependent siderophore receptor [Chitinophaga sp. SYP-B3965]|uniref:TonB-dependent siderophore receptor n=1 Tax=Chitinophaga sp. SYP-B3965 TaxID=2663120 RepID=UPI0012996359|nr:TonB-dependent siderophore receptor [Chitinophaga sp. SYP-B3965]MRG48506.1 TonB-dependent siderophore receptor [Chitinophaga sp. SYP-B3965]
MKTKILFTLLCLLSTAASFAQRGGGNISGKITSADGNPVGGISVELVESGINAVSNHEGIFQFRNIKAGNYNLLISLRNHEEIRQTVTVENNKTAAVNMQISLQVGELQGIIVTGNKNSFKADRTSQSLRIATPLLEVPQNIQVVTNKVLASQSITSMSDGVIKNVSGATRLEHWSDVYTRVNARGGRLAAFRNGVNVTSDWGPLTEDVSFVDHIEFVKGPAGFMMSNGEPAGIYNVVTKKPTGIQKGEAAITYGSFDLLRASLDLDGKLDKTGKLLYRLNLMGQTKNSFRDYEFNDRFSIAPVISYQLDEKTLLTAEYTYQHVTMSDLGSAYVFSTDGYAVYPRNFSMSNPGIEPNKVGEHSAFVNLQHQLDDNWKLTAQIAHFNSKQRSSDIWPNSVQPDGKVIRDLYSFDGHIKNTYGQAFVNGDVNTGKVHHRILAGVDVGSKEALYDWGQMFQIDSANGGEFDAHAPNYGKPANGFPVFDRTTPLDQRAVSRVNQSYTGLYFQDELGFWDNRIRLTVAGRYTFVKDQDATTIESKKFTPRAGLSVSIDRSTSVYALYDQSFIPQTGRLRSGNPPKPITGNNIEFGVKKNWFDGKLSTTAAVYRIIKNNELSADPTSTPAEPYSLQLGQSHAEGLELDVMGEIVNGLSVVANYAYTDAYVSKVSESYGSVIAKGTRIAGFAKHNVNTWLTYTVQGGALKGAGVSAGFSYQIERSSWSWTTEPSRMALPNYFRLDGGLFWERKKIRLTANVFNILDEYLYTGADYGSYYYWQAEPPRDIRFSIAYKF